MAFKGSILSATINLIPTYIVLPHCLILIVASSDDNGTFSCLFWQNCHNNNCRIRSEGFTCERCYDVETGVAGEFCSDHIVMFYNNQIT